MSHSIAWEVDEPCVDDVEVRRTLDAALSHGGRAGIQLSVVFVTDPVLARLHEEALGDPSETDVISFDLGEEGGGPAGELYVSVDCARTQAAQRRVTLGRELALYLVHGALHLCGFDDHEPEDRERMRAAERTVLEGLGHAPDPTPHDV